MLILALILISISLLSNLDATGETMNNKRTRFCSKKLKRRRKNTQKSKGKILAIMIALILAISMSGALITVSAHTPPWTIISYAFMSATPSPVGVGQTINVYMWVDHPMLGATIVPGQANSVRRQGYQLTITAPDGKVTTQTWADTWDPTGFQGYQMTPTEVGTYTFEFNYPGQTYTWGASTPGANTAYTGDVFTAASYGPINVTVTQAQLPLNPVPPLPTAYWTYPINGINWNWYTVASNWLEGPYTPSFGSHTGAMPAYPDGASPSTAHMMWTEPIQWGGTVGGNESTTPGEGFYQGGSYNIRFSNPIVMCGYLYFQLPYGEAGSGGNYVAWNIMTGQQIWSINASATGVSLVPSFGYIPSMDQPNQDGMLPNGALVATQSVTGLGTVWRFYDPATGILTPMNVTNVPGGDNMAGPRGEYLKIILTNYGTASAPNYYLQEWNSSKVFGVYAGTGTSGWYTGTENASLPTAYDWNISVPLKWSPGDVGWSIAGGGSEPMIVLDDYATFVQGSFGGHVNSMAVQPQTYMANMTQVSLKMSANEIPSGTVNWWNTYPQAPENLSRVIAAWDPQSGVFIFWDQEAMDQYGYSLSTGNYIWGPTVAPTTNNNAWLYTGDGGSQENVYNGNLYWTGYNGATYCISDKTGALLWSFGDSTNPNNSTYDAWVPYGNVPTFIDTIMNDQVYLTSSEHSPMNPLYPGYKIFDVNATTGLLIWSMPCYGNLMYGGNIAIASGFALVDNTFDQQIDSYGTGPSQTTVSAPQLAGTVGVPLVIRGTVMDISAGTTQPQQAKDFPNGVPCSSLASMTPWMEYVYMQQPEPTTFRGVPVTVSVTDSNGNCRVIGTATTNSYGMFSLSWAPDIAGNFTVVASFAGITGAYYGSSASTTFYAQSAAPTPAPTATPLANLVNTSELTMYIAVAIIVMVIALAVATVLILRKRP
jgi:hypothetical protein